MRPERDPERLQLADRSGSLDDRRRLRVHHEGERALRWIPHHLDDPAEAGLRDVVGGSRVDGREDLHVELAGSSPSGSSRSRMRVAGRRGVEDGDVERVAAGELDELVERRHLLGTGRVELLAHGRDRRLGLRPRASASAMIRVGVGDRRRLGIDLGPPTGGRTPSTGAGSVPTAAPRTCPMWAAGSVVTSSVR